MGHMTDGCFTLRDVIQDLIGGEDECEQGTGSAPSTPPTQPDPSACPSSECATSEEAWTLEINPSPFALTDSSSSPTDPPGRVGLSLAPAPLVSLSPPSPLASLVPPLEPSLDFPLDELAHHVALAHQGPQLRQRRGHFDFAMLRGPLSIVFPQIVSLLEHPETLPLPDPLLRVYDASAYCSFH